MSPEQRAPVPRDPGRDEPARGLQRLRHGRGRQGPRARTSSGSAPGSTSGATRRTPFERAILRLTGMDLKMEQYQKGERFVRAIADARGPAALDRLWDGPETLPRDGEIDDPDALDAPGPRRSGPRHDRTDGAGATGTRRTAGPGRGPGGAPAAIALSPILSARYRSRDLERIRAAAPGRADRHRLASRASPTARSTTSRSCSAAGSRRTRSTGCWPARRTCRWVHSATAGVERVLTPAVARARPRRHQRPRRVQPADRRVRPDDDPGRQPPAAAAPRAPARADVAAARGRASCAT